MGDDIKGIKIAILATDGFEQSELMDPRKALDDAGAKTTLISLKDDKIKGWKSGNWGIELPVEVTLDQAKAEEYDALLLPGGVMNPDKLRMQPQAVEFVKAFFDAGKPVAAICHGPWMVVEAGVAKGRQMTSWPSVKTDITNAGGKWIDEDAVTDGNLVTSRKPDDIPAFNRAFIKLISASRKSTAKAA